MLFEKVSLFVYEYDRIGVVGKNGCGKSTLIDILRKKLSPVEGSVYHKTDLSIGYLPQELSLPEENTALAFLWESNPILAELKHKIDQLEDFEPEQVSTMLSQYEKNRGYDFEIALDKITTRFGFEMKMLQRKIASLSGGEQTRLALCRILLGDPHLLLLDEPTNHLDIEALQWLENFLNEIKMPYIIISHDRNILDSCVDVILELSPEGVRSYSGIYSFYKQEKEQELHRKIHIYEEQKKKIKKLKIAARKRTQWAHSHQAETGSEGYAPVYECVSNLAKKAMVQAKNLQRRVERKIEEAEADKPFIEKKRSFHFETESIKSRQVLEVEHLTKTFGSKDVLSGINLHVKNGERMAIMGKNGSGKSTLLKILTGHLDGYVGSFTWSPQAKIGYYSQDYENMNFDNSVLEEVTGGDLKKQTFARTVLGCLFVSENLMQNSIRTLSIGERSKIALAKIIVSGANVLVLDEPTNHLEIEAREALEEALQSFNGAILFATHDRYLIEKMADRVIDMDKTRKEYAV
jgi:ATP-binding cassette subfamily F protein 3